MRIMLKLGICLWFLLVVTGVRAQTPLYKNYSANDGLPSSTVYGLCQDHKGFMWFCSNNGVSRFDGTSFKVFTTADGLPDNFILKVKEDTKGRIWFMSLNGKLSFFLDGIIHSGSTDSFLKRLDMGISVSSFNEDRQGNIWFYNNECIKQINTRDSVRVFGNEYFENHLHFRISNVSLPWINEGGMLSFFAKNSDLISFNGRDFENSESNFNLGELMLKITGTRNNHIYSLMQTLNTAGEKVIVADNSLLVIYKGDKVLQSFACDYLQNNAVMNVLEDRDKNIWVSTAKGVLFFENGKLQGNFKIFFDKIFFSDAIQDREDDIWLGTVGQGVFMIHAAKTIIYNHTDASENTNMVKLGTSSTGEIWAGSINGTLYKFDQSGQSFKAIPEFKMNSNRSFYGIFPDINKRTWIIGGNNMAIYENGKFTYYSDSLSWFKSAIVSHSGSIWIGGAYHLAEYKNNKFNVRYRFNDVVRMYSLLESGDSLLVGTEKGLYVYRNSKMQSIAELKPEYASAINDLKSGLAGTIWAATRNNGIFIISGKRTFHLHQKDGLLSDNVKRLAFVGKTVFAANGSGVTRINYTISANGDVVFSAIAKENIPVCEVNDLMIKDSTIWMATNIGLINSPVYNNSKKLPPALSYITAMLVNHRSLDLNRSHALSYRDNNVEIRYTGISFSSFGPVNYRYRLSKTSEWNYTQASSVSLPSLPYGDYFFEVETQNGAGEWNGEPAMLKIHINAPFWLQSWFIALVNVLIIALIILILWLRLRRIRREEMIKQKNLKIELQALRAQLNPHFIFNSLNSIQDFVLNNQKYEASAYLADFARLMRMILDNSRKQSVSLHDEVEFLQYYIRLEQLRFYKRFEYELSVDPEIDRSQAQLPSMVLQPFIENAILHGLAKRGPGGKLTVSFSLKHVDTGAFSLHCVIEDNGIGRKQSELMKSQKESEHHSSAMEIINERIVMYNAANKAKINFEVQDIINEQDVETGTRVMIDFPQ